MVQFTSKDAEATQRRKQCLSFTSGGDKFMTEKEFVRDKIRKFQFHAPLTLFELALH